MLLQIIWNSSTRAELLKFVDQQRSNQCPDGSYEVKDSHSFVYKALSKELYVGNVYLRVYNDQPDFEISEPEVFCVALLDFISSSVHNQGASVLDDQDKHNLDASASNISDVQSDTADGSVADQHVSDDSLEVSDVKVTTDKNLELIKNLQFGLTSLQVCC